MFQGVYSSVTPFSREELFITITVGTEHDEDNYFLLTLLILKIIILGIPNKLIVNLVTIKL